jgi:hypothetical protein
MALSSSSVGGSGHRHFHYWNKKVSGYSLWYNKTLDECGGNTKEAKVKADATWRSLSQDEKQWWKLRAKITRDAYPARPQQRKESPEEIAV